MSGPDCIPVVVLKKCEPELSYILAELFNMCLKKSCFSTCWNVSSVVPAFKNVWERSTAKKYRPISSSVPTRTVGRAISNAFNRFWHAGFLHKLKSYGISGHIFDLIAC